MNKFFTILLSTLLVFCSLSGYALAGENDIVIKEIKGLVQVQKAGNADWHMAEENSTLTSGDKIRSFLESSALLIFPDSSEFRIRENTSLDIKDISQNPINKTAKRELKLNLGSLHYKVLPKKEQATEFRIHSSTSIVGITGTEGIITAKGEGKLSENILIEGSTYNTSDQGTDGRYQTNGNIYARDRKSSKIYSADVKAEAKDRIEISAEHINLIQDVISDYKDKKTEGYQVASIERVIEQAFFHLEKRQYDRVEQTVEEIKSLLDAAEKMTASKDVDEKITIILTNVKDKEIEGHDVSKIYALLGQAQDLRQSGLISEIKQVITQAEKELALLADANSTISGVTFLEHYQDLQKKVLEKEQQGFVLSETKSTLRQSRIFFDQDDKPRAYQLLNRVNDELSLALKDISDTFQAKIDRLQDGIIAKKISGYSTKELELRLEKIKALIKEEDFLKARELTSQIEKRLSTLVKGVSAEWQLKINDLRRDVNYKSSIGYDLKEIYGLIRDLETYQEYGNQANLEITYRRAEDVLKNLRIPAGFEANQREFFRQLRAKQESGYDVKEINDLSKKIDSAVKRGDIKSARSFLEQAKKILEIGRASCRERV